MSKNPSATDQDKRKLAGPLANVIDVLITAGFFVFMQGVAYTHTPDVSEHWKQILAAYTALSLSGVFWLTLQGFRVTLVDMLRRRKAGAQN